MKRSMEISLSAGYVVASALLILGGTKPVHAERQVSIPLIPYRDTWDLSKPRFLDIGNRLYQGWVNPMTRQSNDKFRYSNQQVMLTYDQHPPGFQFAGRITARGLKPNFCYQIKLAGKPVYGTRGWGIYGSDATNERLGYAGRWWDDDSNPPTTNITDSYYRNNYINKPVETRRTIYGYLYIGAFVTDQKGSYTGPVTGSYSYHVTWQSWQPPTAKGADPSFFRKAGAWQLLNTLGYGYGSAPAPVTLYYEYEMGRPQPVKLPPGTYNCRLLLTEESFHSSAEGGVWRSVLANEDFYYDAAGNASLDTNAVNDVVFTIRPQAPSGVAATAANAQVTLAWNASVGAASYKIKRTVASSRPLKYSTIARATATGYVDKAVANGNLYLYIVSAVNAAGESTNSVAVSAKPSLTNQPPTAFIDSPADNALYNAGETIRYAGRGIDPEDGDLPADALSWRIDFHYGDYVRTLTTSQVGDTGTFIAPTIGETSPMCSIASTWPCAIRVV